MPLRCRCVLPKDVSTSCDCFLKMWEDLEPYQSAINIGTRAPVEVSRVSLFVCLLRRFANVGVGVQLTCKVFFLEELRSKYDTHDHDYRQAEGIVEVS